MPCFFLIIENPLWGLERFGSTSSAFQWGYSRSFHISSTQIFSFITIPPQLSSIFPGVLNYCFALCSIFCWREKFFFSLFYYVFLKPKRIFWLTFYENLCHFLPQYSCFWNAPLSATKWLMAKLWPNSQYLHRAQNRSKTKKSKSPTFLSHSFWVISQFKTLQHSNWNI